MTLGGDPADDEYPDKPKRMGWTTYNRLAAAAKMAQTDPLAAALLLAGERQFVIDRAFPDAARDAQRRFCIGGQIRLTHIRLSSVR